MPKVKIIYIEKNQRDNYPNLKTISELKKMKLMPKRNAKPRAVYSWWSPYPYKEHSAYLYDITLTKPYVPSRQEQYKRRLYYEKKKNEKMFKKHLEQLKQECTPCQKVIFDIETTGLKPGIDEILQISAINEHGEILLNEYVKPTKHISWTEAEKVNHISPEQVQNCKTIEELRDEIQKVFYTANELIAYNGNFDMEFLKVAKIDIPDVPYFDVMFAFAPIYGEWDDYHEGYKWQKLSTCASYYGYSFNAHDSLEDVKATLHCYNNIQTESN